MLGSPDTPSSATGSDTDPVLDNPAWAALNGPHARFAERHGRAGRYQPDVCPMVALPDHPTPADWADAATLVGPGGSLFLPVVTAAAPPGWGVRMQMPGVQIVHMSANTHPDADVCELTPSDVPEMLDLVKRTDPGPFRQRTIELGTYLGIRHDGRLIAMAGERLHVPGYTEISAVCTDPAFQGHGFASRLIRAVAQRIRRRGEVPFLHAAATNTHAIALYEHLGFSLRREVMFQAFTAPQ